MCVSSGGIITKTNLNNKKKAYRVSLSKIIKENTKNILIGTTGKLDELKSLNKYLYLNKMDLAFIGRPLKNPNWLYKYLKDDLRPKQYIRAY